MFKLRHRVLSTSHGMERDQFHAETAATGEAATDGQPKQPVLRLHFDGSHDSLRRLLAGRLRDDIDAEEIDVSFRHLSPGGETDEGVIGLSDRVTGRYILEVKTAVDRVREFVQTVREDTERCGGDVRYHVEIQAQAETVTTFEKELLLVYDADGTLLRDASLIPNGVEL